MTWTVPSPQTADDRNLSDSIWPGIGQGTGTPDAGNQLIQAGSVSSADMLFGFPVTSVYPWLEIFPLESEIQITNFKLDAGDVLGIDVTYEPGSPNTAEFLLCNLTKNKCGGTTQTFGDTYTSGNRAEWIVERHLSGGNITSLNEFGTLNVLGAGGTESNSSITSGFVASPSDTPLYMTDCARTQYLATPGLVDSNGNFTDTWQNYGPEEPLCKTPTG